MAENCLSSNEGVDYSGMFRVLREGHSLLAMPWPFLSHQDMSSCAVKVKVKGHDNRHGVF